MTVFGYPISEEEKRQMLDAMKEKWSMFTIEVAARRAGVGLDGDGPSPLIKDGYNPGDVQHRAADRLLQQERKAGRITYDGRYWKKTNPAEKESND